MKTVYNEKWIAYGVPSNFGGNGSGKGDAYEAIWQIHEVSYIEERPEGDHYEPGDLLFTSAVKWDGCTNNHCQGHFYFHTCTRQHLADLGDILTKCYDASIELMPNTWIDR